MRTPDKWLIVKINDETPIYKLFATWAGGYLDGDSWRVNSGIEKIEEKDGSYLIYGFSGSCYNCRKNSWGTTGYGAAVLDGWLESEDLDMEICEEEVVEELL